MPQNRAAKYPPGSAVFGISIEKVTIFDSPGVSVILAGAFIQVPRPSLGVINSGLPLSPCASKFAKEE